MQKILLHSCCSPCACYPIQELINQGFKITLFYYNPNIHPLIEYKARLNEIKKYLKNFPKVQLIEGEYEDKKWLKLTKGYEQEPERGKRCEICYKMRLEKTAKLAKQKGFDVFGSSLSISPHKDANKINKLGQQLSAELAVSFLERDWKKQNGFKKACEISGEQGFYRQNYCGCVFSKRHKKQDTITK